MKKKAIIISFIALCFSSVVWAQSAIYVDHSQKGNNISPDLYGIFFEEISHSGDGGLYAELIQNRGFEEHVLPSGTTYRDGRAWAPSKPDYSSGNIKNYSVLWDTEKLKYTAWSLTSSNSNASMSIVNENPLHENTPHSMKIEITNVQANGKASFCNSGYWGIPVKEGEKYKLRFYLRSTNYNGNVNVQIAKGTNVVAGQSFAVNNSGEWHEYTAELTANSTHADAVLQMNFDAAGTVWVDYVSLFPKKTFKNRENGLREDLAQLLADINPAFVRWPGGCIVEGLTIENRVKWKETIGDPMTRRGEWNRWGYRSTYGFGYHEFLQFCEDTGADAMYVGNVGLSCMFNNGDYVDESELPSFIQDIRDAIEYAIGDAGSGWGAKRAENGHPEPFPLKYVELGNEQWGSFYTPIHDMFYKALKEDYPQLIFISTLGIDMDACNMEKSDMVDPHYYKTSGWFFDNSHYWDKMTRKDYNIYVGEYACNQNVGVGHMEAALSEAAFMSGMERNADMVTMASYAPLIENSNHRDWPTNMVWVKNEKVVGRSSYYVQKMYANNLPDYNIATTLVLNDMQPAIQGRAGIGTWSTQADFKDVKVYKSDGSLFYEADFINKKTDWQPFQGIWGFRSDGSYRQNSGETRCISMMNNYLYTDCVIELKAQKRGGAEGFLVVMGAGENDLDSHYQVNIGGWGNTRAAIEKVTNGTGETISEPVPFKIKNGQWYNIKIVVSGGNQIDCYVDDEYVVGAAVNPTGKIQAIAGYDEEKGETVVKVINGTNKQQNVKIVLNSNNINNNGSVITLAAPSLTSENSFTNPFLISPVETNYSGFSNNFTYTFSPASFTILRIKTDKDASNELNIPAWYPLEPTAITPSKLSEVQQSDFSFIYSGNNIWTIGNEYHKIKNLQVTDLSGKTLINKNAIASHSATIDFGSLAKGYYLIEALTYDGQSATEKVLKN